MTRVFLKAIGPILKFIVSLFAIASLLYALFSVIPKSSTDGGETSSTIQTQEVQKAGLFKGYLSYLNDLSPISATDKAFMLEEWRTILVVELSSTNLVLKWPYLSRSYVGSERVSKLILNGLSETLVLVLAALMFAALLGIPLGVLATMKNNRWAPLTIRLLNAAGIAVPSFVAAILLAWLVGYLLNDWLHLPVTGSLYKYNIYTGSYELKLQHLVLPMLALSLRPLSITSQLTQHHMEEVLQKDYIRTARAKGLSNKRIFYRHALPNAISPVLSAFAGWFTSMLAGAMFVEYVFGWKGIGSLLLSAIERLDYPVMIGVILVLSTTYLVIDTLLKWILPNFDPALRAE